MSISNKKSNIIFTSMIDILQSQEAEKGDITSEDKKELMNKIKDKNTPKGARTGYMYFTMDKRNDVKECNPGMSPVEVSKELGRLWKELSKEDKKPFMKKAVDDKIRYEKEMKTYIIGDDEVQNKCSSQRVKRGPKSAYLFFTKENRREVKECNPKMSSIEVSRELGRLWNELDRTKWIMLAEKDKIDYIARMDKKKCLEAESVSDSTQLDEDNLDLDDEDEHRIHNSQLIEDDEDNINLDDEDEDKIHDSPLSQE